MTGKRDTKTIVIVEDEPEIMKFASRVLQLEGYHVIHARNGDDGLKLARKRQAALVLLDLRLPGRDGWSVLGEMKNEPQLSAIPVIVFTASAGVTSQDKALAMGADDYLVKPLSSARLREAVAQVLQNKE